MLIKRGQMRGGPGGFGVMEEIGGTKKWEKSADGKLTLGGARVFHRCGGVEGTNPVPRDSKAGFGVLDRRIFRGGYRDLRAHEEVECGICGEGCKSRAENGMTKGGGGGNYNQNETASDRETKLERGDKREWPHGVSKKTKGEQREEEKG